MKKYIIAIAILISSFQTFACSMFVIRMNGKVMVGNNEDSWNQNTRIWFEQGDDTNFGVTYVGFDDFWPQGAINEKGLVFDGFAMPYLEIKKFEGKKTPEIEDFLQYIMKTCSTVEEVKDFFSIRDLRGLETGMLYFVDKSGKQLIVEGDIIEIRDKPYDIITNFYPSQYDDLNKVKKKHYQKGRKLIETKQETSVRFCASLLDSLHQETAWGGGTLYSTLYDLNEGIIYLYFNHNFENVIKINIKDELAKENHSLVIPELFPNNLKGQKFYKDYNETISKIEELGHIRTISNTKLISELEQYFKSVKKINIYKEYFEKIAEEWNKAEIFKYEIQIYKLLAKLLPNDYTIYYKLGDMYFKLEMYNDALRNYQKCSKIVPENEKVKEKIELVKGMTN